MLENLDKIDWQNLQHAYGSAHDVPGLIRQLASDRKRDREKAFDALFQNIWHQHTVYEATAYAVPFLLELLANEKTQDKMLILLLISLIAHGNSYLDVHRSFMDHFSEEDEELLQQELQFVANAKFEVTKGINLYLELLNSNDPQERTGAALVLANFPEHAPIIHPMLVTRFKTEEEQAVRAHILMSLIKSSYQYNNIPFYQLVFDTYHAGVLKLLATFALAEYNPADQEKIALLVEALAGDHQLKEDFEEMANFWDDLFYFRWIADFLTSIDFELLNLHLPALLRKAPQVDKFDEFDYCWLLLRAAFRPLLHQSQLTYHQLLVLQTIEYIEERWDGAQRKDFKDLMREFGLFTDCFPVHYYDE